MRLALNMVADTTPTIFLSVSISTEANCFHSAECNWYHCGSSTSIWVQSKWTAASLCAEALKPHSPGGTWDMFPHEHRQKSLKSPSDM